MANDFITQDDLSLFTSGSRFSASSVFLQEGMEDMQATFDLFVREMPPSRNYFMFAGLEQVVAYLQNLTFTKDQLAWLKEQFHFSKKELEYFKNFRFTGDLWAMPEGTLFFPNEPIIRITAPIIEAQFIEMFLTNAVYLQTILASKISRFVTAANGKQIGVGVGRCYGMDTAMMSARINEIFGNANPLALYHYKHNSTAFGAGTFHFLLMAFANEADAFRAYLRRMHGKGYVLIDTYNSERGLKHFVKVAKELEKEGIKAIGVQLDSGDLYALSVLARKMFDEAGMPHLKIFGMSNLDEWKVADLERRGAPIDVYGGLTQLLTPVDAPTMELVYKLSEVQHRGTVEPKMKTSTQKVSLPGRKQVFRHEKAGRYIADTLSLEEEKLDGTPLLQPIMRQGKLVTKLPTLKQIHDHFFAEKKKFDPALFSVDKKFHYPVAVSDALQELAKKTRENITKAHHYDLEG